MPELWQHTQHFDASGIYTGSDVLLSMAANQVWLRQEGNNLEVSQIGTDNKMLMLTVSNAKTNLEGKGTLMEEVQIRNAWRLLHHQHRQTRPQTQGWRSGK
ncbi:MAG: hypothetical protein IPL02_04140 [Moraxellaceae bacterium]|nr:hypothetical protein [Moraxellaceae bacterium]